MKKTTDWSIMVPIGKLKANPTNPRVLRDEKFIKLKNSLTSFPDMLNKRPIVAATDKDGKLMVLGGNMRLRACQDLGMKEVPVVLADDWTEEQRREFIIKDNVGFGEWNWSALANEWDAVELAEWGLDAPDFDVPETPSEERDLSGELKETFEVIISCKDENHQQQVYNKMIADGHDVRVLTL